MHADHITGTGLIKKLLPEVKSGISTGSGAKVPIPICLIMSNMRVYVRKYWMEEMYRLEFLANEYTQ